MESAAWREIHDKLSPLHHPPIPDALMIDHYIFSYINEHNILPSAAYEFPCLLGKKLFIKQRFSQRFSVCQSESFIFHLIGTDFDAVP